ncbi:membrane progestin receptor gamma-A-like, partial [Anneissia japonica]|uniref:membrane progestin receptor gamma-A-like n=1 Tax=Anneissia japonica TaxID=1529436 RepID=UPI001425A50B
MLQLSFCLDFVNDPFTWPLLGQLVCTCLYLSASSFAHLLSCLSERARHVCFFFDYSSMGMYSFGCCIAYRCYSFPQNLLNTEFFNLYIPIGVLNAILMCSCGACGSRFMTKSLFRHLCRLSLFMIPYIFCSLPLLYRVTVCPDDECEAASVAVHRWQFVAAFFTAFIYATHLPERLAPGKFDIFFHSHQLFHLTASIATMLQVNAFIIDMNDRRTFLETAIGVPTFWYSLGLLIVVFSIKMFLVLCFSICVFRHPEPKHIYRLNNEYVLTMQNESIENSHIYTKTKWNQLHDG